MRNEVVSNEREPLILVDEDDLQIGTLDKSACHDSDGILHRAFSLFVFDTNGNTLLQQRHSDKRLWPGYWSNGCCSHPRDGEDLEEAVIRRAEQELGLEVDPKFLFKFTYRESFQDLGTEFELCSVFVCQTTSSPYINEAEIAEWRWISPKELDREIRIEPAKFTPWLKIEWQRLRLEFASEISPNSMRDCENSASHNEGSAPKVNQ